MSEISLAQAKNREKLKVNRDNWKKRALQAEARVRELEQALEDIIKHNEIIGGNIAKHSATYCIANKALKRNNS